MANPAGLSYAKVVGTFKAFTADSNDGDDLPDFINFEGTGTIVPDILEARNQNPANTAIYLPETFNVQVIDGVLTVGGNPYVNVLRSSPSVTPQNFTYTAKFQLRKVNSNDPYRTYGPFSFYPNPDAGTGVVDLALAMPVSSDDGVPVIVGPAGPPGGIDTWKPNTFYAAGKFAISNLGAVIVSKADHTSGATWNTAQEANWTFTGRPYRGWLPLNSDLDQMKADHVGLWLMPSATYSNSVQGWPADMPRNPGWVDVQGTTYIQGSTIIYSQDVWTYGNPSTTGDQRRQRITQALNIWNAWKDPYYVPAIPASSDGTQYALNHQAHREALEQRVGVLGTGGLGTFAFRLDHGAVNARDLVLPITDDLRIPVGFVVNPGAGRLALPENGDLPWSFYKDLALNHGWEIVNHGMDHIDATDTASMKYQLQDSKDVIDAALPEVAVDLFAVPGVSGTNMNGWTASNTKLHFTDAFEAWKHVANKHGASTGYMGGMYRALDGRIRNGETHYTIDLQTTISDAVARIQATQQLGAGLQIMLHPSLVNKAAENITDTVLDEILTYLAVERDAGRALIVSMSGLLMADRSHNIRENLLRNPGLQSTSGWNTTGYSGFTGYAQSTNTAAPMSQNIDLTNRPAMQGSRREIVATFQNTDGVAAVAQLSIEHAGTGLSKILTVNLAPNETKTDRFFVCLPVAAGSLAPTFKAGRLSGGAVRVTNPGVLAA